jgi:polyphenol oxidase
MPYASIRSAAGGKQTFSFLMVTKTTVLPSPPNPLSPPIEIPFLQFPALSRIQGLRHAVYTRLGGCSPPPYESLNTSSAVGDQAKLVAVNLKRIREAFGAPSLQEMTQVHGEHIRMLVCPDDTNLQRAATPADAMVTALQEVALMVKQADCQAVLLVDTARKAIGAVHCGWRGNVADLPGKVVQRMKTSLGCSPGEMRAAIGPSLGPCCAEFTSYQDLFPPHFDRFMVRKNFFDLWEITRRQLLEAGLKKDKIEIAGICTRCRRDLFFSYRGEGNTGRFATLIMVEGSEDIRYWGNS